MSFFRKTINLLFVTKHNLIILQFMLPFLAERKEQIISKKFQSFKTFTKTVQHLIV